MYASHLPILGFALHLHFLLCDILDGNLLLFLLHLLLLCTSSAYSPLLYKCICCCCLIPFCGLYSIRRVRVRVRVRARVGLGLGLAYPHFSCSLGFCPFLRSRLSFQPPDHLRIIEPECSHCPVLTTRCLHLSLLGSFIRVTGIVPIYKSMRSCDRAAAFSLHTCSIRISTNAAGHIAS